MRSLILSAFAALGLVLGGCGAPDRAARDTMPGETRVQAQDQPTQESLRASIDSFKTRLAAEGKYSCCVSPTCDFCATHMGGCPCGQNAAAGKPVCRECKGGWEAGQGVVPGKTAPDIQVMKPETGQESR